MAIEDLDFDDNKSKINKRCDFTFTVKHVFCKKVNL